MERKSIAYSVAAGVELVQYNSKHGAVWTVEHCGQVLFSSVDKHSAIETFCSAIDYYLGFSNCVIGGED